MIFQFYGQLAIYSNCHNCDYYALIWVNVDSSLTLAPLLLLLLLPSRWAAEASSRRSAVDNWCYSRDPPLFPLYRTAKALRNSTHSTTDSVSTDDHDPLLQLRSGTFSCSSRWQTRGEDACWIVLNGDDCSLHWIRTLIINYWPRRHTTETKSRTWTVAVILSPEVVGNHKTISK